MEKFIFSKIAGNERVHLELKLQTKAYNFFGNELLLNELLLARLTKWLSVRLRTKWLWVSFSLLSYLKHYAYILRAIF